MAGNTNAKTKRRKPYAGKTNWLTVALFAFAIILVFGATYGIITMTERWTHSSAQKLVSDVVTRIDDKMQEVEEATRTEAKTLQGQLDNPEALDKFIYDFVNDNTFIYGSTIAFEPNAFPEYGYSFAPYSWQDSDGVHSRQLGEETDFYQEEWYAETKKELREYWCEPYFDEGGAKIMMCTFSVPLLDENGQLTAILTADVGLEDLEEYITSINPSPESYILLRSQKGAVLVNAEKDASADDGNVIIKGVTDIGWTVELLMPFAYLMRGDAGMVVTIGVILFATVLLVYFINLFITKSQLRAKQAENDLIMEKLRADSLTFISDNEPDFDSAISFFGQRILEISGCDQVVYRELNGRKIVLNVPGFEEVPEEICSRCPFAHFDCDAFRKDGTVLLNDCSLGFNGLMVPADCPAKSSFMQLVYSGGTVVGKLTVHYLRDYHSFSENKINLMKAVAVYLGIMIGRIKEKQAEIARIEAESSNRAKTEFLFNMSHDIRTPMNAIIGFTDKAIKHKDDPRIFEESLAKVKASSEYLLRIVNDILDMAKIESGKLELHEELHCGETGNNSFIEVFGAEAAKKGIEFHIDYDVRDKYFWVDKNRANQIVANLISNAIKYTEPGGDIWYRVKQVPCDRTGYGRYTVAVEDTGRGMTEEFLAKIYDAFERDQSAIRSGEQGTGLGMAIVKKLVDAMGGTIAIESEPGKGTTVAFTMEHRLATAKEIEAILTAEEHPDGESTDFTGKRVLLVEDNELNREIAADILEGVGLTVEEADDGTVAVEKLKEQGPDRYDFILMDIQMPTMNGYEAAKAIREMYPESGLPIIALSANAFEEDKQRSFDAGMDAHVAKPIKVEELLDALAKHVKR